MTVLSETQVVWSGSVVLHILSSSCTAFCGVCFLSKLETAEKVRRLVRDRMNLDAVCEGDNSKRDTEKKK